MYYLYKMGQFLSLMLPLKAVYGLATILAYLYYVCFVKDRSELIKNLKIVLKDKADKKLCDYYARKVFINFAKYLVDFFRFSKINKDFIKNNVQVEGLDNVDAALKDRKGVIILSSHLGNWELGGAVISQLGYSFSAIALDHKDKKVNNFFITQRAIKDVKVIPIGAKLKRCFSVLKENELLGILGDRDFSENGEKIKFFGKETLIPRGPAVFSLRTGAPIVPTFMIRQKSDRFKLVFEKPITPKFSGSEKDDINFLINTYTKSIEDCIRKNPDQWYVFRYVWNNTK